LLQLSEETSIVPRVLRAPRGFAPGALLVVSDEGDVWISDRASRTLDVLEADAVDADAVLAADGTIFVAWVDADGSAMLSRENADGTYTTSPLYTDARATRARVWADADDVLVAVAGEDDLAFLALSR
jgi:streptogramin lyase